MLAIDENSDLHLLKRKPWNWDTLELRGWLFLPENRTWDAYERKMVVKAIPPLHAVMSDDPGLDWDRWLKQRARDYLKTGFSRLTKMSGTRKCRLHRRGRYRHGVQPRLCPGRNQGHDS